MIPAAPVAILSVSSLPAPMHTQKKTNHQNTRTTLCARCPMQRSGFLLNARANNTDARDHSALFLLTAIVVIQALIILTK